jgi:hypothetical protein
MKPNLILLMFLSLALAACAPSLGAQTSSGFSTPIPNRLESRDNDQGGEQAPTVLSQTAAQMQEVKNDLTQLTSATKPNPAFYEMSLAKAIKSGKPTVFLLATPAFCQSRLCGPAYDNTMALQERFGAMVNFIHVEVYTGLPNPAAENWPLAPAMQAFGLVTEPWLYLIDKDGRVAYRVEGLFTAEEVAAHIQALLNSN